MSLFCPWFWIAVRLDSAVAVGRGFPSVCASPAAFYSWYCEGSLQPGCCCFVDKPVFLCFNFWFLHPGRLNPLFPCWFQQFHVCLSGCAFLCTYIAQDSRPLFRRITSSVSRKNLGQCPFEDATLSFFLVLPEIPSKDMTVLVILSSMSHRLSLIFSLSHWLLLPIYKFFL